MQAIDPLALFRLSVLGPLVSREPLAHGELQSVLRNWRRGSTPYPVPTGAGSARKPSRPGITPGGGTASRA